MLCTEHGAVRSAARAKRPRRKIPRMVKPIGHYDRAETPAEVRMATRRLLEVRDRLASLKAPASPLPGSMLAIEDQLTAREPLSALVTGARNRATDGLEMIFDAVVHDERESMWVRPIAPYALLRMSIEALGVGQWLVRHAHKSERVMRALRLSFEQEQDARDMARLLGDPRDRAGVETDFESAVARLNELKNAVGALKQRTLDGLPTYSQLLRSLSPPAQRGDSVDVDSPFVVWKLCSGILHGNSNILRSASDLEQLGDWSNGSASFRMTAKWGLIASCLVVCERELAVLDKRVVELSTHNYAGRSVDG